MRRKKEKEACLQLVVLDKTSSKIMFAAVGFSGFLGLGEKYHPLPWALLNYDKD